MITSRRVILLTLILLVGASLFAQNPLLPDSRAQPRVQQSQGIYSGWVPGFIRDWSRALQSSIATMSRRVTEGEWTAAIGGFLLAVAFGVIHIAGPGHGKVFAVSYFSARAARPRDGILYSAIVNAVDSISAFVLVLLGYIVLRAVLPTFRTDAGRILQIVSYALIALFGIAHLVSHLRSHGHTHSHAETRDHTQTRDHDHTQTHPAPHGRPHTEQVRSGHEHSGHDAHDAHSGSSQPPESRHWPLALSVGLLPCPVSTIILVYGVANGVLPLMIFMVVGVSLGGFLTMSGLAVAVISGRTRLLGTLRGTSAARVSTALEFTASGAIILMALALLLSTI